MSQIQPPLFAQNGSNLPSPHFAARPGWGGRLKSWCRAHLMGILFRAALFAAILIVLNTLLGERSPLAGTPTPAPEEQWTFRTAAAPGQGMTHLAAWALDAYLTQHEPPLTLSPVEHLYAVDSLARIAGWQRLERGQEVTFSANAIGAIVGDARTLSATKRTAWSKFLR